MASNVMLTISKEVELRNHLQDVFKDLPVNLLHHNEMQLLDDLCFLLRSPLFLYAVSPRMEVPNTKSIPTQPTPTSTGVLTKSDNAIRLAAAFEVTHVEICTRWEDGSWVAQLLYCDEMILEGRQLNVEQEHGFVQSLLWFCEEASFLAQEFKAREHAAAVWKGDAVDTEPLKAGAVMEDDGWNIRARSKVEPNRRSLKLKIRFRGTPRGAAGVWRVE